MAFTPSQLNRRDSTRIGTYKTNLDFYNGTQWEKTSRSRQLVFNYAKVTIDKVTSFLMQGLTTTCYPIEDTDQARATVARAERLLHQVYDDNDLQQLDWETEIDCAVLGDACYKVTWDADEKRVRITSPIVSGIYAWWLGDDLSKVWRVVSRYQLDQDELAMLYGIQTKKQRIYLTELWTAKQFQLYVDDDLAQDKPNPYGFIPFVLFPNLRAPKKFWGTSDVPALMQPQRELNRAMSQLSRILEFSGNPIAVFENWPENRDQDAKVAPGQNLYLYEGEKAYVLDLLKGGGINLHMNYIDALYRALHDISETPRAAFGGIEKELSGAALSIELGSLTQKVARKRTIRGSAYNARDDMVLRLARQFQGQDFSGITHQVQWASVMPEDRSRTAQNEQLLVQAGIHSRQTAMDEMGMRSPGREFETWLEERRKILQMNQEFRAQSTRGGARERASASEMEVPE